MKKVVRMLGLCALVALAFTSCKKNDNTNKVTFKAVISQPTSDRTHLDEGGYNLVWDQNNQLTVFDENCNAETFVVALDDDKKTTASFSGDAAFLADLMSEGKYTAYYPVNTHDATTVTMETIPATQTYHEYTDGYFADNLYPMYAVNNSEGNFNFTSDAGVLQFAFFGDVTLDRIEVISNKADDELTGTMVYDIKNHTYSVTAPAENANKVVLNCGGTALPTVGFLPFDIVLLPGTLTEGFTVNVYAADGTKYVKECTVNNEILAHTVRTMGPQKVTEWTVVPSNK